MILKKNTLLLIIGTLFILIASLSYFFYIKYKTIIKYINKQFQSYNYNLQNQMINILDKYKKFILENKLILKNKSEDKNIDQFIQDLDNSDDKNKKRIKRYM